MIRTKGEAGTGDVVEAVRHARTISDDLKKAQKMSASELQAYAKEIRVSLEVRW